VCKTPADSIKEETGGCQYLIAHLSPFLTMSLFSSLFPASFDDLVFEGRNQAYGAYQLRQAYNSHVRIALALMITLCALLLLGGAAWQHLHPLAIAEQVVKIAPIPVVPPTYVVEPPKAIEPAEPSLPHQVATPTPHVAANTAPHVVKDNLAAPKPAEDPTPVEVPSGLSTTGPTTTVPNAGLSTGTGTSETSTGSDTGTSPAVIGPYVVVEKMPEFAGGADALMKYLRNHLRYPSAALAAQAEGRVYVSFVVQADGTIADISILKGLGYGLDEEAQRVVRQMPTWTPGKQSNHAVPVKFTLPITFRIQ
jgi:protein TonB